MYVFTTFMANGLKDITIRASDVPSGAFKSLGSFINVSKDDPSMNYDLVSEEEFRDFLTAEMALGNIPYNEWPHWLSGAPAEATSAPPVKVAGDAVNPSHYQGYLFDPELNIDLQWLETQCRMQRYREDPERFKGAVELQVRKYLDRCGKKDEELQEFEKALWYLMFLVAFMKNGDKPVLVKDIREILWPTKSSI